MWYRCIDWWESPESLRSESTRMIPDRLINMFRAQGALKIEPFDQKDLQPVSYDVHLGRAGKAFKSVPERAIKHLGMYLDLGTPQSIPEWMHDFEVPDRDEIREGGGGRKIMTLDPLEFMLGHIEEEIELGSFIAAEFHGKSTLGRVGLLVHATAGLVDPGWHGRLTIELFNLAPVPIRIWRGMPIGQFVFYRLAESVFRQYGSSELDSHYQGDMSVASSRGVKT